MNEFICRTIFDRALKALGLELDPLVKQRLWDFFALLMAQNKRINLVSSRQPLSTQVVVHLVDSLTPLLWPDWPSEGHALDLGSGGGLPALPLAIARPGWNWDLAEATGKKILHLRETISTLGLNQVKTVHEYLRPALSGQVIFYDLITARAVASLSRLIPLAAPRLAPGGRFLAYKGPRGEDEYRGASNDLKKWRLTLERRMDLVLPLIKARRTLFLFVKE